MKKYILLLLILVSLGLCNHKFVNVEKNGGTAVNIQDQTTEPQDTYFIRQISAFTLAQDITASTLTTLNYTIEVEAGHALIAGDELILLEVVTDKDFFAQVVSVNTNTIIVDRPIDNDFLVSETLAREVSSEMAVDGSVTPVIFTVRSGSTAVDNTRFIIQMTHAASGDDSRFGGIAALTNGLVLRIVNSFQKTIFNFKDNGDIKAFCYDLSYSDKAGGGLNGTSARITFGGQSKHGVVLRVAGPEDALQWVVQDDLTGLSSLKIVAQGHSVTD